MRIIGFIAILLLLLSCARQASQPILPASPLFYADPNQVIWFYAPTPTPTPSPVPTIAIPSTAKDCPQSLREAVHLQLMLWQRYYTLQEHQAPFNALLPIWEAIQTIETCYETVWADQIRATRTVRYEQPIASSIPTRPLPARTLPASCQGCCSHHGGVVGVAGVTQCADGIALSLT